MLYWWSPNIEADGNTAYNNVRVGRPPTQRNWNSNFYRQCKLAGPQHRSWRKVSLQKCASWQASNTENFEKKFYRQCKLAGPQHREIGTPISTGNESWGGTEINFAKISFLSYSLYHFCSNPVMLKF
ncbi:Nitrogen regulation protein NIFR3 [Staphylococcus aureus]|nr:Nitrogen regulation protein NIFR3 [Staphylococcus aureus]